VVPKKNIIKGFLTINAFAIVVLSLLVTGVAAEDAAAADAEGLGDLAKVGLAIGAGLAAGVASAGAGVGVGIIGAAALGAIAEKKEMSSWSFIFIALAEGVAFYGLIIAFILMGKI
jgi:V/A-type H+-transporting ATPase subunit K